MASADGTRGLMVLIVDDEPVNRVVLARIVEHLGSQCVEAASGPEECQGEEGPPSSEAIGAKADDRHAKRRAHQARGNDHTDKSRRAAGAREVDAEHDARQADAERSEEGRGVDDRQSRTRLRARYHGRKDRPAERLSALRLDLINADFRALRSAVRHGEVEAAKVGHEERGTRAGGGRKTRGQPVVVGVKLLDDA